MEFLSGERGKGFHQLSPHEQVPKKRGLRKGNGGSDSDAADLHGHGTPGYAWFGRGSDYHGLSEVGICFNGLDADDQPLLQLQLKDEKLLEASNNSTFLQSLRISCSRVNEVYPPLALAQIFLTQDEHTPRVRRLHLTIVDLKRRIVSLANGHLRFSLYSAGSSPNVGHVVLSGGASSP